jgi:hypothetical protein
MEIANIVTDSKLNVGPEFNVVGNVNEIVFTDLPTLLIGYKTICEIHGEDNINVLNRKINKTTFWTFKKNEKRQLYQTDLEDFIRYSYRKYVDRLNYVDVDVIQFSKAKLRKIIKKMFTMSDMISYESENSVIYCYANNLIFGIDLNNVEYVGFDVNKVREKIKERSKVFLTGSEILLEYSNHLERLEDDIKLIPFLYSINPHE